MKTDPTRLVVLADAGDVLFTRRRFGLGLAAAAAAVALPKRAEAGAGLWLAGVFVGWAINKMLDHFWNGSGDRRIAPYISDRPRPTLTTPSGFGTTEVEARANGENLEARACGTRDFHVMPASLPHAMDCQQQPESTLNTAFNYWGAPSSTMAWIPAPYGFLVGQWWSQNEGANRYIVTRSYQCECFTRSYYIPYRGAAAEAAEQVVTQGNMAAAEPRLSTLFRDPTRHVYLPYRDAPANS